jgi:hypothetical protein
VEYLGRVSDELPNAGFCSEDPTAILTVLTGGTGVLADRSCTTGDEATFPLWPSALSGLVPRADEENEFRKLFRRLPFTPLAELGALRRTTRFLGAGLLSRLPTGDGCLGERLLSLRDWRVARVL